MIQDLQSRLDTALRGLPGTVSLTLQIGSRQFRHRDDQSFASASLIKIPILLTALEAGRTGDVALDEPLPIPAEGVGGGGLVEFFDRRSTLTLRDLLLCMIAISDNAATNAVITRLGFSRVNDYLKALGLRNTVLNRRMMDATARAEGRENLTTPADMHAILKEILDPQRVHPKVAAEALTYLERQQLPHGLGYFLPEGSFAHKTGELEGICHDVGILFPYGPEPVIITFLSKDMPSIPEAQIAAGRIGRIIYENVARC